MKQKLSSLLISIVTLMFYPCLVVAQDSAPIWIDSDIRNMQYPQETHYTGFSEASVTQTQGLDNALNSAKQRAIGELSERIRLIVNSNKTSVDVSLQGNNIEEQIRSKFSSVIGTSSQTEITGSKVQTYYNTQTRTVYAFVYVNKAELKSYYQRQINSELSKVDVILSTTEQLIAVNKKIKAREQCSVAKEVLDGTTYYQGLLVAVNSEADENVLQLDRSANLQYAINKKLIDLEQSTLIYLNCQWEYKSDKDNVFDEDPGIICNIVKQALTENECSIIDDPTEADYELILTAYTTQRSDGSGQYGILSYYANVKGMLYNRHTGKKTVDFSIFNDAETYAVGKTPEIAATKAFRLMELKDKILEKVLPKIKN